MDCGPETQFEFKDIHVLTDDEVIITYRTLSMRIDEIELERLLRSATDSSWMYTNDGQQWKSNLMGSHSTLQLRSMMVLSTM